MGVNIVLLLQLLNTILVECPVKKDQVNLVIHSSIPFFFKIYRSLLYAIQLKAPLISRLSIDTIHPRQAYHTTQILEVIKERAKRVNYFFYTPICIHGRSPCTFIAFYMHFTTIFSNIFLSVFSRATSRQLFSKKQSFLFAFWSITIIISLQYSSILPLRRQVVRVFIKGIATAFNMALIILFKILSSPAALPVGSFYIVSFIFFSKTIQLIFKGRGKSQLLMSCRSA